MITVVDKEGRILGLVDPKDVHVPAREHNKRIRVATQTPGERFHGYQHGYGTIDLTQMLWIKIPIWNNGDERGAVWFLMFDGPVPKNVWNCIGFIKLDHVFAERQWERRD